MTLTANSTAAAAPRPARCVEAERDEQHVAGQPLDAPRGELRRRSRRRRGAGCGRRAGRGAPASSRARAWRIHACTRASATACPPRSSSGRDEHGDEDGQRRDREQRPARPWRSRRGRPSRTSTTPRITSATMLSSVWDTSVPSTTGSVSRGAAEPARDDQRARGLAQARGQRRRHEHADERALHRVARRTRACGQRRAQDRVPGDGAQRPSTGTSAPSATSTQAGSSEQRLADVVEPIRCSASARGSAAERRRRRRRRGARSRRSGDARPPRASGSSLGRRCGRAARPAGRAGSAPSADRGALARPCGRGHRRSRPRRPRAPRRRRAARRSAGRARRRPRRHRGAARGLEREVAQGLGERGRVAARDEHAVARRRARRRGSRRCRDATTGVPAAKASVSTMPKLSPPSDGAHSTSALASAARLRSSDDLAEDADAAVVEQQRRRPPPRSAPTISSSAGTCSRSASKARSSTGRPLRSTAWPTNTMRSGRPSARGCGRIAAGTSTPLGMIAVAPAEEAPAGPRRGLGHGDPRVQRVEPAPRADQVRRCCCVTRVLGVAVERPDERRAGARRARPSRRPARPARGRGRRRSRRRAARGAAS